jgi:hypothetical protein
MGLLGYSSALFLYYFLWVSAMVTPDAPKSLDPLDPLDHRAPYLSLLLDLWIVPSEFHACIAEILISSPLWTQTIP